MGCITSQRMLDIMQKNKCGKDVNMIPHLLLDMFSNLFCYFFVVDFLVCCGLDVEFLPKIDFDLPPCCVL